MAFCQKLNWIFVVILMLISSKAESQTHFKQNALNNSVSAIFIFGDSTSDPGNNNYIKTAFKGNFKPYGRDFANQIPTGRFTNGLLTSDFIARYVGVKDCVPPYLDPTLSMQDLMTGVSFASAGSGFDPLTPKIGNVISLSEQLDYFRQYQTRLAAVIGEKRTKKLIRNALYIVSAATNDFVVNYFTLPIRRKKYNLPEYMEFVLKQEMQFLQSLWNQGARRIGVAGLAPMGCLPIVITLFSTNPLVNRDCLQFFSAIAATYNEMLQNELNAMQFNLAKYGARIAYLDTYAPLTEIIVLGQQKYGFVEINVGCCGTGLLETSFLCNPKTFVCPDASKYVFWDSIHPTQTTYNLVFKALQPAINSIITT